jgi:hypothetical protein
LTLVGKNFLGYGTALADNFVRLLESGANISAPRAPLVGQLWYDTSALLMRVWTGTGWASLAAGVTSVLGNTGAVTLNQLTTGGLAPSSSPVLTGIPQAPTAPNGTQTNQIASTEFVLNQISALSTGVISVVGNSGIVTLNQLVNGGLAPSFSPTFTGVPKGPTAINGTSTTQLATTAFVVNTVGALSTGVQSVQGNTGIITLQQMIAGGLAPLASPNFTGTPQVPTATAGTSTNQIASTAFVTTAINGINLNLTSAQIIADLGYTPVQQGGTSGQNNNKVYIGWDGTGLRAKVDATDQKYLFTSATAPNTGVLTLLPQSGAGVGGAIAMAGNGYASVQVDNVQNLFRVYNPAAPSNVFNWNVISGLLSGVLNLSVGQTVTSGSVTTGSVTASGGISGASLNISGAANVTGTLLAGVLRSGNPARGSNDPNRVPILFDYVLGFIGEQQWYHIFPNGFVIQQFSALVPISSNGLALSTLVTLPYTFPTDIIGAVGNFLGNNPVGGVSIACQPASPSQVAVTTAAISGPGTVGITLLAFGH